MRQPPELPHDDFEFVEMLRGIATRTSGVFGQLWRARQLSTGRPCAIRVLDERPDEIFRELCESGLLEETHGCLSVLGLVHRPGQELWVVSQFCPAGSAGDLRLACGARGSAGATGALPEDAVAAVLRQAAVTLAALHSRGRWHGHLKSSNLLLTEQGQVLLGDLGMALIEGHLPPSYRVSDLAPYWLPPEAELAGGVACVCGGREAMDVWQLGIVAYELSAPPSDPLDRHRPRKAAGLIRDGSRPWPAQLSATLREQSAELRDFIARCLERSPAARPPLRALLEHPLIAGARSAAPVASLIARLGRPPTSPRPAQLGADRQPPSPRHAACGGSERAASSHGTSPYLPPAGGGAPSVAQLLSAVRGGSGGSCGSSAATDERPAHPLGGLDRDGPCMGALGPRVPMLALGALSRPPRRGSPTDEASSRASSSDQVKIPAALTAQSQPSQDAAPRGEPGSGRAAGAAAVEPGVSPPSTGVRVSTAPQTERRAAAGEAPDSPLARLCRAEAQLRASPRDADSLSSASAVRGPEGRPPQPWKRPPRSPRPSDEVLYPSVASVSAASQRLARHCGMEARAGGGGFVHVSPRSSALSPKPSPPLPGHAAPLDGGPGGGAAAAAPGAGLLSTVLAPAARNVLDDVSGLEGRALLGGVEEFVAAITAADQRSNGSSSEAFVREVLRQLEASSHVPLRTLYRVGHIPAEITTPHLSPAAGPYTHTACREETGGRRQGPRGTKPKLTVGMLRRHLSVSFGKRCGLLADPD